MGRALLLVILIFAAGAGLGFWAGWKHFGEKPPTSRSPGVVPAEDDPAAPVPGAPVTGTPAAPTELPPAPIPAVPAKPTIAELLAALPAAESPRGGGVITGRVVTPEGQPVPGARIAAERVRTDSVPDPQAADRARPMLEERLRRAIEGLQQAEADRREAVTDTEGRFRVEGLLDSNYEATASAGGYRIEPAGNGTMVRPGDRIDFIGRRVVPIDVTVLLPDGTPAPMATVRFKRGLEDSARIWRPEHPRLECEPGRWIITAVADADTKPGTPIEAELSLGDPNPPLVLRLEEQGGMRLSVVFPPAFPFRAVVAATQVIDPTRPPPLPIDVLNVPLVSSGLEKEESWEPTWTLAPGAYFLVVGTEDRSEVLATTTVDVGTRLVPVEITLPEALATRAFRIKVLGPDGLPRLDASVSGEWLPYSRNQRPNDNGIVTLPRPSGEIDASADPRTWLNVYVPHLGEKRILVDALTAADLTVAFAEAALLEVTIEGAGVPSNPFETRVELRPEPLSGGVEHQSPMDVIVDRHGRAVLGPLQPCPSEIVVGVRQTPVSIGKTVIRESRVLTPGTNKVSLALPARHTVTVIAPIAFRRGDVILATREGEVSGWSDEGVDMGPGRFLFEHVPPGTYRLIHAPTGFVREIGVSASMMVEFSLPAPRHLAAVIDDPQGLLSAIGFLDRDLVVAVDGRGFSSREELSSLVLAGTGAAEVVFTIERAGERLSLPLEARFAPIVLGCRLVE